VRADLIEGGEFFGRDSFVSAEEVAQENLIGGKITQSRVLLQGGEAGTRLIVLLQNELNLSEVEFDLGIFAVDPEYGLVVLLGLVPKLHFGVNGAAQIIGIGVLRRSLEGGVHRAQRGIELF